MPNYKCISTQERSGACWITLNRPESFNSINTTLINELAAVIDDLENSSDIHAIVITGNGKAFSAGGDLKEMEDGAGGFNPGAPLFNAISKTLLRLENLSLPVIAAVNGICIAGGLEIALACDIVIASEHAKFGDGHANYGLLPGGGGSVRLPRKIGINRAKFMMITGHIFSAKDMADWGLVNQITEEDNLVETVNAITNDIAKKSPLGIQNMKRMINRSAQLPTEAALELEQSICALHDYSIDRNEGLQAFSDKRQPEFVGK